MPDFFALRLIDAHQLAPAVRHLVFAREDGAPFAFVPGQFIHVHFDDAQGKPAKRCYSIATPGDGGAMPAPCIEIVIACVAGGAASALLGGLKVGERINASGPYGRFCLLDTDANARYLFVATGTGVASFRAMLPQLKKLFVAREVQAALIHGVRTEAELLYGEEFEAFARAEPRFRYYACLSRGPRVTPRPHDRVGRVQAALDELQPNAATDIVYLCGNPAMVDETFEKLKSAGLPIPQIRRERYVSLR